MENLRDKLTQNNSWCPVPWADISTNNTGDYRVCVQANSHRETRGLLKDENEQILSLDQNDFQQARNSELLKDIRRCMVRGEQHPVCERCNYEDANRLESRRQLRRSSENIEQLFSKTLMLTASDGGINCDDFSIEHLDLRFGNLCNLSCRSCYPGESSGWFDEWHANMGATYPARGSTFFLSKTKTGKSFSPNKKLKWYENENFIKNLEGGKYDRIHISGGEPLLIKQHLLFLKKLVERGEAQNISLDYNTNLTTLPEGILSVWKHFKKINLGVSLDGPEVVNSFVRFPSDWQTINKNLRALSGQDHIYWWPTFTVMAYNVWYIPEFLKWKLEHFPNYESGLAKRILFTTHMLQHPPHLRISIFPEESKRKIQQKLENFEEEWLSPHLQNTLGPVPLVNDILLYYRKTIAGIVGFMNGSEEHHRRHRFFERNGMMDNFRKQNAQTALPEFWDLLTSDGVDQLSSHHAEI